MGITIDKNSGFCFGVIHAIESAEKYLKKYKHLYSLGDIVHNNEEMKRLISLGLEVISFEQFKQLKNTRVLIRAHGEPPATYKIAEENQIELIDATCCVVLALQQRIKEKFLDEQNEEGQILIFGKKGHAEVVGLLGQTENKGIVITSTQDIDRIDFSKPATLYSQTTQNLDEYNQIIEEIKERYDKSGKAPLFSYHDTICRRVVNRAKEIQKFASQHDKIIFVSGEKSSNGLYLFSLCKEANPSSFFISYLEQLDSITFLKDETIGICGATSTPMWLMEDVAKRVKEHF
ncbi:MAG TPA: 4-hydroxy-3-methylbut-2-enyl diphosphate reductase [Bacteroidales bacterium]|jgi:4-hydroxy-3-methylbut-2-enyl diphosphate reductase|nr:4-hydroxy-3-methylbut-2-enyl diphosphate reductase [Bacteroidales bacterium]HOF45346.1 4-hydroxy-3-methylbut-2-enyl diphosphate reductase [Bacteroidales bacterium]HOS57261.1 4-hydroxy-3-methylbut-2-enyl diphosphate reductase [Bacteroidales bacterium]HRT13452.1 4-hydroxy-3-methylbut-2-enyl diphosphate reductase [Bacteroidales bacterium]